MNFSIVIPTYNRQHDLLKCLSSILEQSLLPTEIVIIDDGQLANNFIGEWRNIFLKINIKLIYYQKNHELEKRGSSESRNKALQFISNKIFFILDDDVVLDTDFCKHIMNIWLMKSEDNNLIGVGGIIKNRRKKIILEKIFNIIFGLNSKYSWDVNSACFQVWDEEIKIPTIGYYAHGGVCSYNLQKTQALKFTTFSGGRTALEDVDFCLRAKNKGYQFIIEPTAQLCHYPSQVSRETKFLSGYKESYNRRLIFKSTYQKPSLYLRAWFYWANLGWILRQFLVGSWRKGSGMIKGFFSFN